MEKVTIRLAKSLIGRGKEQIAVAHSLGCTAPVRLPSSLTTQLPRVRSLRSPTWLL